MTPEDLLRGWVKTHGPISMDWSQDFMARPEVKRIVEYRDANVVACVRKHKRLVDILKCLEAEGGKVSAMRPVPNQGSPSARQFPDGKSNRGHRFGALKARRPRACRTTVRSPSQLRNQRLRTGGVRRRQPSTSTQSTGPITYRRLTATGSLCTRVACAL